MDGHDIDALIETFEALPFEEGKPNLDHCTYDKRQRRKLYGEQIEMASWRSR